MLGIEYNFQIIVFLLRIKNHDFSEKSGVFSFRNNEEYIFFLYFIYMKK